MAQAQFGAGGSEDRSALIADEQALTDRLLKLSQAQVATLLGISPQAVSKGLKEHGFGFFAQGQRAQSLYNALLGIGGARFADSAALLKQEVMARGWGLLDDPTSNLIRPGELYQNSSEIWVVSDSPIKCIDWDEMKSVLFDKANRENYKVVVFFLSSLEAAEDWAEVLERESISTAISGFEVAQNYVEASRKFGAFVYLVVTNLTAFSGDFVVSNPGSACMGIFAQARSPGMYHWHAGSYFPSENPSVANEFIRAVHHHKLGRDAQKANFFPLGVRLGSEQIDFPPRFIDGLIAKRGSTESEDTSEDGLDMCGGILRARSNHANRTKEFNKKTKFCGVFILTYKRKPGDSVNTSHKKTYAIVRDELELASRRDESKTEAEKIPLGPKGTTGFW